VSAPNPNARFGWLATGVRRDMSEKGWAPLRYWILWWSSIATAVVIFYVLLTPIWLGLRGLAWVAEWKSRFGGSDG
jgi:hypothetical protein